MGDINGDTWLGHLPRSLDVAQSFAAAVLARGAGICHAQVVAGTWQGVPALPGSVCKLIMSQAWMGSSLTRVSVQANVESRMGQPWLISQHIPGLTRVSVGVIISHRNLCIWHPHSIMCHKSSKASWWRLAYPGQCTQQLHKNHEQTRTDTTGPMMRCDRRYNNTSQPWWRCRTGARRGKGKTAESGRDTRESNKQALASTNSNTIDTAHGGWPNGHTTHGLILLVIIVGHKHVPVSFCHGWGHAGALQSRMGSMPSTHGSELGDVAHASLLIGS